MPLSLRRKKLQIKYANKIKTHTNHLAKNINEDSWHNHYGKFKEDTEPFFIKTKEFEDIHKSEIETNRIKQQPPWHDTKPHTDTTISRRLKTDEISKPYVLAVMASYKNCLEVYTDVSKSSTGIVSAAMYIPEAIVKIAERITDSLTVYSRINSYPH